MCITITCEALQLRYGVKWQLQMECSRLVPTERPWHHIVLHLAKIMRRNSAICRISSLQSLELLFTVCCLVQSAQPYDYQEVCKDISLMCLLRYSMMEHDHGDYTTSWWLNDDVCDHPWAQWRADLVRARNAWATCTLWWWVFPQCAAFAQGCFAFLGDCSWGPTLTERNASPGAMW